VFIQTHVVKIKNKHFSELAWDGFC